MRTMVVSVGVETWTGIGGGWVEWVCRPIIDNHDNRIQPSRAQRDAYTVAIKRVHTSQNATALPAQSRTIASMHNHTLAEFVQRAAEHDRVRGRHPLHARGAAPRRLAHGCIE